MQENTIFLIKIILDLLRKEFDPEKIAHAATRRMNDCVLWLDRGRQICFSESVGEVCDAYEEFLITKKIPEDFNGIRNMALEYQERLEKMRVGREKTEEEKLLDILKKGDRKAAERAAREFLKDMKS